MGLYSTRTGVLLKWEETQRHTQREHHVTMEAEMGVTQPQSKKDGG